MEDQDIVGKMFKKGDELRAAKYADFSFNEISPEQQKFLTKLSYFSKNRDWIIKKFNGRKITRDIKVHFLDHHSMKLGNGVFYDLESKRYNTIH